MVTDRELLDHSSSFRDVSRSGTWLWSRGLSALLPWPSPAYLDLQRVAQEGADENDRRQYRNAGQSGRRGDGTDDVAGHEQFQAKQNGLAKPLAEAPVDIMLVSGGPDGAVHERDHCASHDDQDPRRVDAHPDLVNHVVVAHLAPC